MAVHRRKDRGPNDWLIRIHFRGKQINRAFTGSKDEARAYEARLRVELEAGAPVDSRRAPTLSEFSLARYAPHARLELAPGTLRNRAYQVKTLLTHLGDIRLTALETADIERFVQARLAENYASSTIADDLKVLKAILNFAKTQNVPVKLPKFPRVKVKGRKGRVKIWTAEQIQALYAAAAAVSPVIVPLLVFLANTGCRKTEALRLRWEGIDFEKGEIWVEPVEDEEEDIDWTPKDNEARQVPMSSAVRTVLARLWSERELVPEGERSQYVFVTRKGTPYAEWPQLQFDRARDSVVSADVLEEHKLEVKGEAAGERQGHVLGKTYACPACKRHALKGGPHTFRHSYASHFLAARPDLFTLGKLLGQSQSRVTELYSHLLPGAVQAAAGVVNFGPT